MATGIIIQKISWNLDVFRYVSGPETCMVTYNLCSLPVVWYYKLATRLGLQAAECHGMISVYTVVYFGISYCRFLIITYYKLSWVDKIFGKHTMLLGVVAVAWTRLDGLVTGRHIEFYLITHQQTEQSNFVFFHSVYILFHIEHWNKSASTNRNC